MHNISRFFGFTVLVHPSKYVPQLNSVNRHILFTFLLILQFSIHIKTPVIRKINLVFSFFKKVSVSCGQPPSPPYYSSMVTETQMSMTFECNEGYILEGNSTVRCRRDGTWSPVPQCIGNIITLLTVYNKIK